MSSTEMFGTDHRPDHHSGGSQLDKRFRTRKALSWWQAIAAGAVAAAVVILEAIRRRTWISRQA
ncbi:MAG: hypothetical protein M3302_05050 [Actinomycetota bacterium]|jgi:hypothetical protein|nr:hypothetical protein [Actinomycetota bacterium]